MVPATADTPDVGVTDSDRPDGSEVSPAAFVAVTVNLYAVPDVSPLTMMVPEPACDSVPVVPPGIDVAVYFVIGEPPFDDGAVNATLAVVESDTVAAPITGALGDVNVVTDPDGPDGTEVRAMFDAVTVNV